MDRWLYIFGGFPGKGTETTRHLHAGGLQYCVEEVEELAILDHDPVVQLRKEGVFLVTPNGEEEAGELHIVMSPVLLRDGITFDWFPEKWTFGNGVTISKTIANLEYETVVHGTYLTLDEFLAASGASRLGDIELERRHIQHEGWKEYEARWLPGTCPQENHQVCLTLLISTHAIPDHAYQRIRYLVENGAEPRNLHEYDDHHFSVIREYGGESASSRWGDERIVVPKLT